jgi:hypothetical protein
MNRRLAVHGALGIAVSLVAFAFLVRAVDLPVAGLRFASIEPVWLVIPLVSLSVQLALRSWRWALLLSAATGATVRPRRVLGPLTASYLVNAVLPARLGEVVRTVLVARGEGRPIGAVAASVIVERMLDLAALIAVGLLATGTAGVGWSGLLVTGGLIIGLAAGVRVAPAIAGRLPGILRGSARASTQHLLAGIASIGLRASMATFALSALAWSGDVVLMWACARAIGVDLGLLAAVAIAVGAALGTAVPAASGYLGTYELGAVALGSLAGTAPETILAIAVVAHVLAVVPVALLGFITVSRTGWRITADALGRSAALGYAGPPRQP